jgi:FkbM family methyltransferase
MTLIPNNLAAPNKASKQGIQSKEDPFGLKECLIAYEEIRTKFAGDLVRQPGRLQVLAWDLEYVSGLAIATFIDYLLVRRINDFIPDNDRPLILDCGANIGFSVLNYKRQFPQARIIAFEPDPQFAPVLRRNLERNGAGDVQVVEAAVWVRNGETKWFCEGIDGSHIIDSNAEQSDTVDVRTVDLADYLTDVVDLLKLDIEGAEYQVVSHLGNRLQNVKNILIECHLHQTKVIPFGKMLEVLSAAGFKLSVNSFGTWRDLIRQTPILPNHWEQYLLVAGWRGSIPSASPEESVLPYVGAKPEIELQTARGEVQELQKAFDALEAQQRSLEARENQWIQHLKGHFVTGKHNIETKQLEGPFVHHDGLCWSIGLPSLEELADDEQHPSRSSLILFEDENILQPAHALHEDIGALGKGRFSHWMSNLYFSTSDGSDPNTNGRKYIALFINAARESGLDVREREVTLKEGNLSRRSAELMAREAEVSTHAADLAAREAELKTGESNLNQRVAEAATHEGELAAREAELNNRSAELKAREAKLGRHVAEVTAREAAYDSLALVRIRRKLRRIFGV